MPFLQNPDRSPVELFLSRDLVRSLKRGHPWVFADALRKLPVAPGPSPAILRERSGREIAKGFYTPDSTLAFRACITEPSVALNDAWVKQRMQRALELRRALLPERTTGYRLFNGEGDGLPGLVCDVYGDSAVIKPDGPGPAGFWDTTGVAEWVTEQLGLARVYLRHRVRGGAEGQPLVGDAPTGPVPFEEHGLCFTADLVSGQKTGFFLDMRDNRHRVAQLAAGRRVVNLFGYTGGFSVHAGAGGATHVTTVDVAAPAIAAAEDHWRLNDLPTDQHTGVVTDAFEWLDEAYAQRRTWDLVILDPPSFASSRATIPKALAAYRRLVASGAAITAPGGLLCAGSCSSHVDMQAFVGACGEGMGKARLPATVLGIHGQPFDHPSPLAFPEGRYLKFVVLRVG